MKQSTEKGGTVNRIEFDSIHDLATWFGGDEAKAARGIITRNQNNNSERGDFLGAPDDPENFLITGWHDAKVEQLAARAASCLKSHAELITSPQIALHEHVAGALVNIPAYLAGDPSYMFMPEIELVPKTHPVVTIVISACVSAGLSNNAIERRGVYALALVRACQTLGYSVDLWHEWRTATTAVVTHLMRPGDVLSDSQLMATLVHRAWTRYFPFIAGEVASPHDHWNCRVTQADKASYPDDAIITYTAPRTDDEMAKMVKQSLADAGVLKF